MLQALSAYRKWIVVQQHIHPAPSSYPEVTAKTRKRHETKRTTPWARDVEVQNTPLLEFKTIPHPYGLGFRV